jgi:hypothetical protein
MGLRVINTRRDMETSSSSYRQACLFVHLLALARGSATGIEMEFSLTETNGI